MSQSLINLVQRNQISNEEALGHATEIEEMRAMLGIGVPGSNNQNQPRAVRA